MRKAASKLYEAPAIGGGGYLEQARAAAKNADALHLEDLKREHGSNRWPTESLSSVRRQPVSLRCPFTVRYAVHTLRV